NWGRFSKTFAFWILILLIPVALIQFSGARNEAAKIYYTQYRAELARDNIKSVTIQDGKYVQGEFRAPVSTANGRGTRRFVLNLPAENSEKEVEALASKGVVIEAQDPRPSVMAWVLNFLPWLLLIGFYLFLFR